MEGIEEQEFLIEVDNLDNISDEDMEKLKVLVDEYQQLLESHGEELNDILERINDTHVYKELGIQIHVSQEYMYSMGER